ncbi:hypothetical protein DMB66_42020 [Actinoplanes sp. ATCC 53533]|uniref:alpha/beta hydrolase n=1 Tax=Actinoplanes sp. ATCC 53533 TaxID=1288362 RepID=UPI000F78D792|nr:alpha/beta fold hydrolase [Actinoplanes sp. ATCC 53533]RSM51350.1 hypothetical protein DMB66_42020 [Actinoplanes sp. ATCC 53533]
MSKQVVFVHGLWIHSASWQPWQEIFAEKGYDTIAPGWPGEAPTVDATRVNPAAVSGFGVEEVTAAYAKVVADLGEPPIVVGHSAPFDHGWRALADDALGWLDQQRL